MKKPSLPTLLSFNAGYADTAGFLAFHGLFTAHVTGNFVTLGASLVHGSSGAIAKILALPVFCVVVVSVRLLRYVLIDRQTLVLRSMLLVKLLLLVLGTALALYFGPFPDGDSTPAIFTGLTFVAALSVQNAVQRVHLTYAPPTTLMTGTTTQLMIDLADKWHGVAGDQKVVIDTRLAHMATSVFSFAIGCAGGAVLYDLFSIKCFVLLPVVALLTYCHKQAYATT